MMQYLKQIKLVQAYPDRYPEIISDLTGKVIMLINQCNADTIEDPIKALKYLAKQDA